MLTFTLVLVFSSFILLILPFINLFLFIHFHNANFFILLLTILIYQVNSSITFFPAHLQFFLSHPGFSLSQMVADAVFMQAEHCTHAQLQSVGCDEVPLAPDHE
jgi:hypothetical protein